ARSGLRGGGGTAFASRSRARRGCRPAGRRPSSPPAPRRRREAVSRNRGRSRVYAPGGPAARLTAPSSTSAHARRAPVMNQLPAGLRLYRQQLRAAIEQDLTRGRPFPLPRPPLRFALPALVGIAAAAAAVAVVVGAGTQAGSADAAILDNVVTALTPPPGTIL